MLKKSSIISVAVLLLLLLPMISPVWAVYPVCPAAITAWGENGSEYAETATDGTFSFDIAQGNYSGMVIADGFIDRRFNFTVVGGNTTNLGDLLLSPSARVTGQLIGPNGDPIPSGTLYLWNQSDNSVVSVTVSGSNGSFAFSRNVRTGTYCIRTATEVPGCTDVYVCNISATEGQTTSGVTVQLARSGAIAGTVKSITNDPIEGAWVIIFPPNNLSMMKSVSTDSQGFYNLSYGLPAGTYNVSVAFSEIHGYISKVPDAQVTVQVGQTATANFALHRSANISGTVRYSDGAPAEGIAVFAVSTNGLYYGEATTDDNGNYAIDMDLAVSDYTVVAEYDFMNAKPVSITQEGQAVTGVDFELGRSAPAKAWIRGTVTSGGQPVSAAVSANGSFYDWSSANGSYMIEVELPEGQTTAVYNVTASKTGYFGGFRFPVNVSAGQTVSGIDISIEKMPSGTVVGRVVSNVAPPRQNAQLTLTASTSNATVGASVTLSGSLTPPQAGTVSIFQSLNGSSYSLLAEETLSGGSYSHALTLSQVGTYTFYATWPGNDAYNPATSPTVTILSSAQPAQKTTPSVTISSSKLSITLDANHTSEVITVTGTISPFPASTAVNLRVTDPNSQVTTIPLNATSPTFTANVTIDKAGTWSIQAQVPEGATYNAATSNTVSISVQSAQAGGADNTLLIAGVVIALVVIAALLLLFMRRRK